MIERLREVFNKTWQMLADQAAEFLPKLLAGLVILLVGFLIARLVRGLVARLFVAIRLDRLSARLGVADFLARGDVHHTLIEVLATVIYWLVLLFSFELLGTVLGLEGMANFFGEILGYVPRLVVALVILLLGVVVSPFFAGTVQVAASNAGFPAAKPLGQAVRYLVVFFALVIALEQLRIATELLVTTLQIVIGAVALAFALGVALAFGLGCKDLASEAVQSWLRRAPPQPSAASDKQDKPNA